MESKQLVSKSKDMSQWYVDVLRLAGIVDTRYGIKGAFVWMPYGFKIMQNLKKSWDAKFQKAGIEETYFPLIVPIEYCEKNESWWAGFKSEGYKVVAGSDNQVQGALRPTGEPAIYPMYSLWVRSKNDLPIRYYETVSSFRYETKHTRPLIRDREITVWHEIHTAHASREEAESEMELHMEMWDEIWESMALPVFKVRKPNWECFPGAIGAIEYYNTTPQARAMENGSVNNLGQAYSKKFDIKFKEGDEEKYAWQICTGNGARWLGAVFLIHGDDKGLVMPPKIAPIKTVVVPIILKGKEEMVNDVASKVAKELGAHYDDRDISAGRKFFDWEIKGVPIRIEIGPRDVANKSVTVVRRDTGAKDVYPIGNLKHTIDALLAQIHKDMLAKATGMLESQLSHVKTMEDLKENIDKKISLVNWCGSNECYNTVSGVASGVEGFGTQIKKESGQCMVCDKNSNEVLYVSRTY